MTGSVVRLAAIADIHYSKTAQGALLPLFAQIAEAANVLMFCGDLTDYVLTDKGRVLAKVFQPVKIPMVGVLGNHEFEAGQEQDIARVLTDVGVHMLDGDTWEYRGVGFAGTRGFCGGFGRGALGPWGEKIIKDFVHEAVQESLKLESALARLGEPHRIVLLHYSPIRATVEGEPPEIFRFLGSSRLEDPISRFDVTAVFHGHAHKGAPEGKTQGGIPVYNVAHAVLRAHYPDRPPFRLFEIDLTDHGDKGVTPIADRRSSGRRATDRQPPDKQSAGPGSQS